MVNNVSELFGAPMRLRYDQQTLRLLDVQRGPFLSGDGQQVVFSDSRDEAGGLVIINMNRVPGAGGISGSGVLLELRFQAIARGSAAIRVEEISLRDARLEPIAAAPPSLAIQVP
ncbi:MAG: cohesin domain-containing protein [Nitrososphaerota archaeon]